MIQIKLKSFIANQLVSIHDISVKTGIHEQTLYRIRRTGRLNISTLRKIADEFPKITNFIEEGDQK